MCNLQRKRHKPRKLANEKTFSVWVMGTGHGPGQWYTNKRTCIAAVAFVIVYFFHVRLVPDSVSGFEGREGFGVVQVDRTPTRGQGGGGRGRVGVIVAVLKGVEKCVMDETGSGQGATRGSLGKSRHW